MFWLMSIRRMLFVLHRQKYSRWPPMSSHDSASSGFAYHARRSRAMPTAFAAHTMLKGSFSVVSSGMSREEW